MEIELSLLTIYIEFILFFLLFVLFLSLVRITSDGRLLLI